jgi:hypothetical protein
MPLHFLIASVFCMGGFAGRSVWHDAVGNTSYVRV